MAVEDFKCGQARITESQIISVEGSDFGAVYVMPRNAEVLGVGVEGTRYTVTEAVRMIGEAADRANPAPGGCAESSHFADFNGGCFYKSRVLWFKRERDEEGGTDWSMTGWSGTGSRGGVAQEQPEGAERAKFEAVFGAIEAAISKVTNEIEASAEEAEAND